MTAASHRGLSPPQSDQKFRVHLQNRTYRISNNTQRITTSVLWFGFTVLLHAKEVKEKEEAKANRLQFVFILCIRRPKGNLRKTDGNSFVRFYVRGLPFVKSHLSNLVWPITVTAEPFCGFETHRAPPFAKTVVKLKMSILLHYFEACCRQFKVY